MFLIIIFNGRVFFLLSFLNLYLDGFALQNSQGKCKKMVGSLGGFAKKVKMERFDILADIGKREL
jgi:hypothetical protein